MKNPIQSKTIWFNFLMSGMVIVEQVLPAIENVEGGEMLHSVLLVAMGVGNIILRFMTTQPVGMK
ncbi:MAG: hypothetical protein ACPGSI_18980 [Pikeienuella sp.]